MDEWVVSPRINLVFIVLILFPKGLCVREHWLLQHDHGSCRFPTMMEMVRLVIPTTLARACWPGGPIGLPSRNQLLRNRNKVIPLRAVCAEDLR